jgi:hypothetical protein
VEIPLAAAQRQRVNGRAGVEGNVIVAGGDADIAAQGLWE